MADMRLLAARLGAGGLLDKPLRGMSGEEMAALCRAVLEAHVQALPASMQRQSFFCPYGKPAGKNAVHCRANLYAAGVFSVPSPLYGVPIGYCLNYCNVSEEK